MSVHKSPQHGSFETHQPGTHADIVDQNMSSESPAHHQQESGREANLQFISMHLCPLFFEDEASLCNVFSSDKQLSIVAGIMRKGLKGRLISGKEEFKTKLSRQSGVAVNEDDSVEFSSLCNIVHGIREAKHAEFERTDDLKEEVFLELSPDNPLPQDPCNCCPHANIPYEVPDELDARDIKKGYGCWNAHIMFGGMFCDSAMSMY